MAIRVDPLRSSQLNDKPIKNGPVIYFCSRDQRVNDNWALLRGLEIAQKNSSHLVVAFCLIDDFPGANTRHYQFMLDGIEQMQAALHAKNIPFYLLNGSPAEKLPPLAKSLSAGSVICDFSPLKLKQQWDNQLAKKLNCAYIEVDAHNIVPARYVSGKQEYAARTIRPKIHALLDEFLTPFPKLPVQNSKKPLNFAKIDWPAIRKKLFAKLEKLPALSCPKPGEKAAQKALREFISHKLPRYDADRNDPNADALSNMSPYLHFGQISAQKIALEVQKSAASQANKEAYLEELIVRRELSDNFCLRNDNYDNFDGLPNWAKITLKEHAKNKRNYNYNFKTLEKGLTHSRAWNAAQLEMVYTGKMHGYMRMYWAKKILQWTKDPQTAIQWAIKLNDHYELDGRDPNGFVGVLWAIGGLHDRPWKRREIFGTVRYMNEKGLRRKFDLDKYIEKIEKLASGQ